jgi:alanine-glyoxylate transaminase/serine-glyoxylate transaminase/serine-pyruvate transaminase
MSFYPPRRTLMGPGPSDVDPRILLALARPTIGHLDPAFVGMMDELRDLLRQAFLTRNEVTFPVSGPGSAGMETCFVNLVEPGDTVVVCVNGVFGGRMVENVERCGGTAVVVEDAWGEPVDAAKLEGTLQAHPEASLVSFVHAETSTGAASDAEALARIAHAHDCLVIADTVTSLGGIPVRVDDWGLDAVYSGTQKCLSCVPGLSPVTFGPRAMERVKARKSKVQSWFLDLNLVLGYWGDGGSGRAYHHTAPVNSLVALHEALLILLEEGLDAAWERHRRNHLALRAGLEALGLSFLVDEASRLPQLNAVKVPDGVDEGSARQELLAKHNLEIGAGLGPFAGAVWRIGLMGYSSRPENVFCCLESLGDVLSAQGVSTRDAVAAARGVYDR